MSSKINQVNCGAPQGSVLGPLFFCSLYHLHRAAGEDDVHIFADDTAGSILMESKSRFDNINIISKHKFYWRQHIVWDTN